MDYDFEGHCEDCGSEVDENNALLCYKCEKLLCPNCDFPAYCDCYNDSICEGCRNTCEQCGRYICADCNYCSDCYISNRELIELNGLRYEQNQKMYDDYAALTPYEQLASGKQMSMQSSEPVSSLQSVTNVYINASNTSADELYAEIQKLAST